jgi:hypothetical protein
VILDGYMLSFISLNIIYIDINSTYIVTHDELKIWILKHVSCNTSCECRMNKEGALRMGAMKGGNSISCMSGD